MPSRRQILAGLTGLAIPAPALAAAAPDAAFRRDAEAFVARTLATLEVLPGVSVAFVERDRPLLAFGQGLADTAPKLAADGDSAFYIASATKSFTALAVSALARKGIFELDAPVAAWLPDHGLPPAIGARVTMRQFLSHTSGLDNFPVAFRAAYTGEHTPAVMQRLLAETIETPATPAGTFRYSNAGYNVATLLIERKTGLAWQDLLVREVIEPLGLKATTPWVSRAKGVVSAGHLADVEGDARRSPVQKVDATMQSAGGLLSSAEDMTRWLRAQLNDGVVGGRRVFPAGLVAAGHAPVARTDDVFGPYTRDTYGLGWQIGRWRDEPFIHHFGNFAGSRAHVSFMPAHGLGAAVMVNEDAVCGEAADLIANYLYERRLGRPDVESRYRAQLLKLRENRDVRRKRIIDNRAQIAARPRTLSKADEAYFGRFESPAMGGLTIAREGDGLVVRMGRLSARAQPFTKPETIRIELVPGQGQSIQFMLDTAGAVMGAAFAGYDFARA